MTVVVNELEVVPDGASGAPGTGPASPAPSAGASPGRIARIAEDAIRLRTERADRLWVC